MNSYVLIEIHFDIICYIKFIVTLLNMQKYLHFTGGEYFRSHIHYKNEKAKI